MTIPRRTLLALCAAMLGLPVFAAPTIEAINDTPGRCARGIIVPVVLAFDSNPNDCGWTWRITRIEC